MLGSRIRLKGDGAASILRRAAGGFASPILFNKGRTTATGGTAAGDEGIVISDLALDGNKGNATKFESNQQGIWLSLVRDSMISRVWVYGQRTNGIALEYCQGVTLTQCIARDNLKNGFYLSGS